MEQPNSITTKPAFGYCPLLKQQTTTYDIDGIMDAIKALPKVRREVRPRRKYPEPRKSPADPPASGSCPLLDLPLELFERIIEYVFSTSGTYPLKALIRRRMAFLRQGRLGRPTYNTPALHISRRWQRIVWQPFLRLTTFDIGNLCKVDMFIPEIMTGGISASIRRVRAGTTCFCGGAGMTRLPSLIADPSKGESQVDYFHFEGLSWIQTLLQKRGLHIAAVYDSSAAEISQRVLVHVGRFNAYIWLKRALERHDYPSASANAIIYLRLACDDLDSQDKAPLLQMLLTVPPLNSIDAKLRASSRQQWAECLTAIGHKAPEKNAHEILSIALSS